KQLAESIVKSRELAGKPLRVFASIDEAVKARTRGLFPLSPSAAKVLTERGVTQVPGGFSWSTDQRLLAPSAFHLTKGQIHAFISSIKAKTRVILAREGMPKLYAGFEAGLSHYPAFDVQILPGGHHLHLEQQAADVAALINDFL
ncbi:MAG TPA: alpha/beta hydrolase, partial [Cellvibrionaceae bacterium]